MKKLIIGTIVVAILTLVGLFWYFQNLKQRRENLQLGIACTMDAKICSDGTAVGRSGPNCDFAPCPGDALCEGDDCQINAPCVGANCSDGNPDEPVSSPVKNEPAINPAQPTTFNCAPDQRVGDMCIEIYDPVCATIPVQCVKTPCDPIRQTFSNACHACLNTAVISYTLGECLEF